MPPIIPPSLQPQPRPLTVAQQQRARQGIISSQQPIPLTQQQIEQQQQEFIQQESIKQKQIINNEIQKLQDRLPQLQKELSSRKTDSGIEGTKEKIEIVQQQIRELGASVQYATGEYDIKSIISYAKDVGSGIGKRGFDTDVKARVQFREQRETSQKATEQQQKQFNQQIKQLEAQGLTPIRRQGQVVGFRDEVAQVSVPIESLIEGYSRPTESINRFQTNLPPSQRIEPISQKPISQLSKKTSVIESAPTGIGGLFQRTTDFISGGALTIRSRFGQTIGESIGQAPTGARQVAGVVGQEVVGTFGEPVGQARDFVLTGVGEVKQTAGAIAERGGKTLSVPLFVGAGGEIDLTPEFQKVKASLKTEREREVQDITQPIQQDYANRIANFIQDKYYYQLQNQEITWEEAVKRYEKTQDYNILTKEYTDEANRQLESFDKKGLTKAKGKLILGRALDLIPETRIGLAAETVTLAGASQFGSARLARTALGIIGSEPISEIGTTLYRTIPGESPAAQFGKGAAFTILSPNILLTAFGTEIGKGLVTSPGETIGEIKKQVTESPFESAGFLVGGILKGKGESLSRTAKLNLRIQDATEKAKYSAVLEKSISVESALDLIRSKKSPFTPEIREFLSNTRGINQIDFYRIKTTAAKGLKKDTPLISGGYVEFINAQGVVIRRIGFGNLKATLKGKTIKQDLVLDAVGEIDKTTGKYLGAVELFTATTKQTKRKPLSFETETSFLVEEASKPKVRKEGIIRTTEGEGVSFLIGKVITTDKFPKLSAKKFLGDLDQVKKKAVRVDKSKIERIDILRRGEIEFTPEPTGDIFVKSAFGFEGRGLVEKVPSTIKKKPIKKSPVEQLPFRDISRPSPSISKQTISKPVDLIAPSMVAGGEVGTIIKSRFAGGRVTTPTTSLLKQRAGLIAGDISGTGFKSISPVAEFGLGLSKATSFSRIASTQIQPTTLSTTREGILSSVFKRQIQTPTSILTTQTKFNQPIKDVQDVTQGLVLVQRTQQRLRPTQSVTPTPSPFFPLSPPKITPKVPGRIAFLLPGEEDTRKDSQIGYHTYVREKGKYKKVSKKPQTISAARSRGARLVDNTTAATFKIEPIMETKVVNKKTTQTPKFFKNKKLVKDDGYFGRTSVKYRDYVVKKGKKFPMNNRWIERKGVRADTEGEQKGLSIAKYNSLLSKQKRRRQGRADFFRL